MGPGTPTSTNTHALVPTPPHTSATSTNAAHGITTTTSVCKLHVDVVDHLRAILTPLRADSSQTPRMPGTTTSTSTHALVPTPPRMSATSTNAAHGITTTKLLKPWRRWSPASRLSTGT